MKKKSQGMPLETIIIAILVIIVLVIVVLIFTGRMGIFRKGIEDCESKGGTLSDKSLEDKACYKIEKGKYCCLQIGGEETT